MPKSPEGHELIPQLYKADGNISDTHCPSCTNTTKPQASASNQRLPGACKGSIGGIGGAASGSASARDKATWAQRVLSREGLVKEMPYTNQGCR
jgi:hypothetical protein